MMNISDLRLLYLEQELLEAIIEPAVPDGHWIVECRHHKGGLMLLTDEDGGERQHHSIEQASRSVRDIGFRQVRIAEK